MKPLKNIALSLSLLLLTQNCFGGGIVYDPTNWIENFATATQTASMLQNQAQQIQYTLQNLKNYNSNAGWTDISSQLLNLGNVIRQGQALSYNMGGVDTAFHTKYPGYSTTNNYAQQYQGWSGTTLDTIQGVLSSVGMQSNFFASEQGQINALKVLSQSSQGRMQALQTGNMIAATTVSQLQELRQLVMAQTNAQNTYMAYQVQKDQSAHANADSWAQHADADWPGYRDNGYGSNSVPTP